MGNLSDYTSPIFGGRNGFDLEGFQFTPFNMFDYFPTVNSPENQKRRDDGRYYGGDIYWNYSFHNVSASPSGINPGCIASQSAFQRTVELTEADSVGCILAVPRRYGTQWGTLHNDNVSQICCWNPYIRRCAELDTTSFVYYFLFTSQKAGALTRDVCKVALNRFNGDYLLSQFYNEKRYNIVYDQSGTYAGGPQIGGVLYDRKSPVTVTQATVNGWTGVQWTSGQNVLTGALNVALYNETNKEWYYSDWKSAFETLEKTLATQPYQSSQTEEHKPYPQYCFNPKTIDDIIASTIVACATYPETMPLIHFATLAQESMQVGSFIASGFPIFTVDNIDQMWKYFAGKDWESENDLTAPPADWSTDWDIYIKGAQRPEIFITMQSAKLEEWIKDKTQNKKGLSAADVSVEYRYTVEGSVGDNSLNSGGVVEWVTDRYNATRATDYMSNVQLNYEGWADANGGGEFSDLTIDALMNKYAEMEFRISYGEELCSSWCKYEIGVIGSPSVPDFSLMRNVGEQMLSEWMDKSTVTLHYDEYPDGYNPYPTDPTPPAPPPDDTDPKPIPAGQNGIGLLTTTYKMTTANVEALGRFLWSGDLFQKIKALNLSPIENIVGLTIMPININGTSDIIVIGDVNTNINGDKISEVPLYTLGSVQIQGRYNSFLDYEPYTTIHIFLPFVGFVRLDPVYVTGKTLKVVYAFDVINGLCNAMLFVDGVYVESHQGQCGIDIPLVSSNRAELAVGLSTSLVGTAVSAGSDAAFVAGMAKDLGDYVTGFHSQRQGGYSPTVAWNETRNCFLVIETPNASYSGTYAHDKGLPCNASHTIGSLSGFTVCDSTIDLSGISGATEEEKAMIKEMLTSGVYV